MPIYIYTSVFLAHLQQQVIFIFFALHNEEDRPTISSTHHAVSVSPLSQNRGAPEWCVINAELHDSQQSIDQKLLLY